MPLRVPRNANLALYGRVGDMLQSEVDAWAEEVENYFALLGGEYYTLKVKGFLIDGEYQSNDRWSKKQIALVDHGDFIPDYHMVLGGTHPNRCGEATSPGAWGNVYTQHPSSECGIRTACHEHLHQLGLKHSGRIDVRTGELRIYGDTVDIMGSSAFVLISAPKVWQLGWCKDNEYKNITETTRVRLAPLEVQARDLVEGEYRFVRVPKEDVFISTRKARTFYPKDLDRTPEIVYVHWLDESTGFTYRYSKDLKPGETMTTVKGTRISYLEYHDDNEQAVVEVVIS